MRPAHLIVHYFITLIADCRHNSRHYGHIVLISHQSLVSDNRMYKDDRQVLHYKTHRSAADHLLDRGCTYKVLLRHTRTPIFTVEKL